MNFRKFMIMGINEVTRALEKNTVCCVLLDVNVEPSLMIKHIVTMAVNKKIPVLLLPILKTVTLEKMGFATTTFALKVMYEYFIILKPFLSFLQIFLRNLLFL